jgi:hypothetical protein
MKSLTVAGFAFLTAVSGTTDSQTVPAGRAQLIISEDLGELPQTPLFWHLYNYPSRAAAEAEAARRPRATVVEAFEKIWLYSIARLTGIRLGANTSPILGRYR